MNMNFSAIGMMADQRMAEDRKWAARCRLAAEADPARREARQAAGSPLAGLLRYLASAARFRGPMQPARLAARALIAIDSAVQALGDSPVFPGMM
jgi:hypothetical protein